MARARFVADARRRILAAFLLCVVAGLTVAIVTSQARSGADCETVEGTLVERQVGADPLRTRGRLKGDIEGRYAFVLTNAVPSQSPDVLHFDGRSEVQTEEGGIFFSDSGAISTVGRGNLAYLSTITDGSGEWDGATGQLLFRGFFSFATGRGKSDYVGKVCARDDD
jgi:hypothetical protein